MRNIVEFATADELRKIREASQGANNRQGSFNDLLLRTEYAGRKLRFPIGRTMVRIVPAIRPSVHDWMIDVHALSYRGGRHSHPRTLAVGTSAFDHAYVWLCSNNPASLFSKSHRDGYRLLADPVTICWAIVEEGGSPVARLLVASGYDGSRGGVPGLGYQIQRLVNEGAEGAHPAASSIDPEEGVMIAVEKIKPAGARYASYTVRRGSVPAPVSTLISRMAEDEVAALCPLEKTIRILGEDEEWARLEYVGLDSDTIAAIRSSVR
ncbi:MAG: hypothetical protein WCK77_15020 [Verrucomicrobiota bacterium]